MTPQPLGVLPHVTALGAGLRGGQEVGEGSFLAPQGGLEERKNNKNGGVRRGLGGYWVFFFLGGGVLTFEWELCEWLGGPKVRMASAEPEGGIPTALEEGGGKRGWGGLKRGFSQGGRFLKV